VQESPFWSHFDVKTIVLPRQARDKHRENSKKRWVLCRVTRTFELPTTTAEPGSGGSGSGSGSQLAVKKAEVIELEEQATEAGRPVMVYRLRCTALSPQQQPQSQQQQQGYATSAAAAAAAPPQTWELSKLFSDFASLRHQLMIADKQSKLDSLDLKQVRKRLCFGAAIFFFRL
jgi:hypothetical protein